MVLLFIFLMCFGHLTRLVGFYLVPPSGIEPGPSAVTVYSLNHWTARELPIALLIILSNHT